MYFREGLTKDERLARAFANANDRLRDYVERRISTDATDVARLYRASRSTLIDRLRNIYVMYLGDEPTYVKARMTGAAHALDLQIDTTVHELADSLGRHAVSRVETMLGTQGAATTRHLRRLGLSLEQMPITAQNVLHELTTSVIGGGTFFDRAFHMTDKLRKDVSTTVRQSLLGGEDFDDMRGRLMKAFGVDKLAAPTSSAYGSVKHYKNEARRQWNLLMQDQSERNDETREVWWATIDEASTPGCVARHGYPIREGDEVPPRHYNSFHPSTRISALAMLGFRRLYQGRMLRLVTRQGYTLTVTPEHPILTPSGLCPAKILREGDDILCSTFWQDANPCNEQDIPPTIEQAFETLRTCGGGHRTVQTSRDDFHGDPTAGNGQVDIVAIDRQLLDDVMEPSTLEFVRNFPLVLSHPSDSLLMGSRALTERRWLIRHASASNPRGSTLPDYLATRTLQFVPFEPLGFGSCTELHALLTETMIEHGARDAEFATDLEQRGAGLVARDEIVEIVDFDYSGHVYDLQSESGLVVTEHLITSNCRCTVAVFPHDMDLTNFQAEGMAWLSTQGWSRRAARLEEAWDAAVHPRDDEGQFTSVGGGTTRIEKMVKDAGAKFNGIQHVPAMGGKPERNFIMLTDEKTGSTTMVPIDATSDDIRMAIQRIHDRYAKHEVWYWGEDEIKPAYQTLSLDDVEGHIYRSVPWRELPAVATGLNRGNWTTSIRYVTNNAQPDHVVLFAPQRTKLRAQTYKLATQQGELVPLIPKRGRWIPVVRGMALDGPQAPDWNITRVRFPLQIIQRWPQLRPLTFPAATMYVCTVVGQQQARLLTLDRIDPGEIPGGWKSSSNFADLANELLAFPSDADPYFVMGIDRHGIVIKMIVHLQTGDVIYSPDEFPKDLLAPYTRVAAVAITPEGLIWSVRPKGKSIYVLPGGHIDPDETASEAVVRELKEETGVQGQLECELGRLYRPWSTSIVYIIRPFGVRALVTTPDENDDVALIDLDDLVEDERLFLERHGISRSMARV